MLFMGYVEGKRKGASFRESFGELQPWAPAKAVLAFLRVGPRVYLGPKKPPF